MRCLLFALTLLLLHASLAHANEDDGYCDGFMSPWAIGTHAWHDERLESVFAKVIERSELRGNNVPLLCAFDGPGVPHTGVNLMIHRPFAIFLNETHVQLFDDLEREGIFAHEIGHITKWYKSIATGFLKIQVGRKVDEEIEADETGITVSSKEALRAGLLALDQKLVPLGIPALRERAHQELQQRLKALDKQQ